MLVKKHPLSRYFGIAFAAALFCMLLSTCSDSGEEQDQPEYPILYQYSFQEYEESMFFKRTDTGIESIIPNAQLLAVDSMARNEISFEALEFPYKEVELLSDSTLRIEAEYAPGNMVSAIFPYSSSANYITVALGSGNVLEFEHDGAFSQLYFCLYGYFYNYFDDFFQERAFSGIVSESCSSLPGSISEVAEKIMATENIAINDSLVIIPAQFIYKSVE